MVISNPEIVAEMLENNGFSRREKRHTAWFKYNPYRGTRIFRCRPWLGKVEFRVIRVMKYRDASDHMEAHLIDNHKFLPECLMDENGVTDLGKYWQQLYNDSDGM